jgi:transcriptional regulator with XRE-family HTH domain
VPNRQTGHVVDARKASLAERLNRLFATVHPADRGPYSNEEVARTIRDRGGEISRTYLAYLRSGERDNPTMQHLDALATFFGVPPSYFFDDDAAARVDTELEMLVALRDNDIRSLALRASDLSPKGIRAVTDIIERIRDIEGLPTDGDISP